MKTVDNKPHITKQYRLLDGEPYYKCTNEGIVIGFGDTPAEAYMLWKQDVEYVKRRQAEAQEDKW